MNIVLDHELPTLNLELVYTLIKWAEADEKERATTFAGWGKWNQNLWAQALVPADLVDDLADDEGEMEKALRNGVCQTAYCMAGQTVYQSGYRLVLNEYDHQDGFTQFMADTCIPERATSRTDDKGRVIYEDVPGAPQVDIAGTASEILGLDSEEAQAFFSGDNGLHDLKGLANYFAQRRGMPLAFPTEPVLSPDDVANDRNGYDEDEF